MSLRPLCSVMLLCFLAGCRPPGEATGGEQNNSAYRAGKEKLQALDYKGAIAAFERALEENPRSVATHFELGLLYDLQENDYPAALYHYNKALKLRPSGHPADNIRQRIPACKQELLKADSLSVLNPAVLRETERLRDDNQKLLKEVESLRAQLTSRHVSAFAVANAPASPRIAPRVPAATSGPATNPPARAATAAGNGRLTTLPPRAAADAVASRSHSVKAGETPSAIARHYRISLNSLLAANPGLDPKRMKIGQTLNLP